MRKTYQSIFDYHCTEEEISVQATEWPHLRVGMLREVSDEVLFQRTVRHGLVMTLDGTARHLTRMDGLDDETPSLPDQICAIPEGLEVHLEWTNHQPLQTSIMIEFDDALFQTYASEVLDGRFATGHLIPSNFAARPVLGMLVRLLASEIDPQQRRGRLFADMCSRLLALEVASTLWTVPVVPPLGRVGPDRRIRRAIDYIEANYAREISVTDICAAAGLSLAQMTTLFRRETGRSPYTYVIDRRLRQATDLLRTTDLPIAIVALEAGFNDQAHLNRMMRARLNTTPRALRR